MWILGFRFPLCDAVALPPEIGFLRAQGFPSDILTEAAGLARASGTDAAAALLNTGLMAEETYYRALARALDAPFLAADIPASSAATRELLGWEPTGPTLLEDIAAGHYDS